MYLLLFVLLLQQGPAPFIEEECMDPCEEEVYIQEELEQIQQEETEQNFNFW